MVLPVPTGFRSGNLDNAYGLQCKSDGRDAIRDSDERSISHVGVAEVNWPKKVHVRLTQV